MPEDQVPEVTDEWDGPLCCPYAFPEFCGCEYVYDEDDECYRCGGSGSYVREHCCDCGGSPYCDCCKNCRQCIGNCKCPVNLTMSDGTVKVL